MHADVAPVVQQRPVSGVGVGRRCYRRVQLRVLEHGEGITPAGTHANLIEAGGDRGEVTYGTWWDPALSTQVL